MTSTAASSSPGTGTITGDGKVGSIGGITHKMLAAKEAGATAFLVPADNCAEALTAHDDDMKLIKVDTLSDGGGCTEDVFRRWRTSPMLRSSFAVHA